MATLAFDPTNQLRQAVADSAARHHCLPFGSHHESALPYSSTPDKGIGSSHPQSLGPERYGACICGFYSPGPTTMLDDTAPLASLSVTHVYYDPDDQVSLLCAYLALLPQALCIVYTTLILSTREIEIVLMFAGQLGCEALNFLLKRLIKEERPRRIHGKGYGMPSSHAQFVAFWSVSVVLFLLVRHRPHPRASPGPDSKGGPLRNRPWSVLERVSFSLLAAAVAAATAWSRIYLNYHTPRQVVAGSMAGVVVALAWFAATSVARQTGLLAWGLDLPIARLLRLRDLIVSEDVCQAGWEKWERRNKAKTG
ncbi:dolichyl pyrophosphate phosphatase [Metarhizium album ARSEF 1941]|uniref:Dolichyldiphosphatase n=1 Tax=Metarhizium album (strain ARSEF 1941) TaxID=1081103 RepID=A0A0B2WE38_METAS|nr:dolichyl pyrophosphate phosphatase [Metarhizium album ARSEF 1941]KHN94131.1 dolichyl pyrophosphate phosphatase [Metarhizium album ARSEF 1941]